MKQIFTLVFVLFFALKSQAQRWFPVGATFTFSRIFFSEFPYPPEYPAEWSVADTVTKKGKLCRELKYKDGIISPLSKLNHLMYVYDSNGVVYWYRPNLDSFTVLYDFNKNVGDTWEIFGLKKYSIATTDTIGCSFIAKVKIKDTVLINGFPLRRLLIEQDGFSGPGGVFEGYIIEFVGHLERPRPDPFYSCGGISESNDFFGLRCFDHPDIGFHDFKLVPYCDYVPSSIDEFNAAHDVNISPNPAADFFNIEFHNLNKSYAELIITNLFGQQVAKQSLHEGNNNCNSANWFSGLYIYQIIQEGKPIARGKISKQ